jgi:hypothetical protein
MNRVSTAAVAIVAVVTPLMLAVAAVVAASRISVTPAPPPAIAEGHHTAGPTAAPPSLPPAAVRRGEQPVVLRGNRSFTTPPFALGGGNYTVHWAATPGTSTGCFHGGFLRAVDGTYSKDFGGHGPGAGETLADAVMPGHYYIEAISGCDDWTMMVAPR